MMIDSSNGTLQDEKDETNINLSETLYSEDEVFFGPVRSVEKKKIEKCGGRRTEIFDFSKSCVSNHIEDNDVRFQNMSFDGNKDVANMEESPMSNVKPCDSYLLKKESISFASHISGEDSFSFKENESDGYSGDIDSSNNMYSKQDFPEVQDNYKQSHDINEAEIINDSNIADAKDLGLLPNDCATIENSSTSHSLNLSLDTFGNKSMSLKGTHEEEENTNSLVSEKLASDFSILNFSSDLNVEVGSEKSNDTTDCSLNTEVSKFLGQYKVYMRDEPLTSKNEIYSKNREISFNLSTHASNNSDLKQNVHSPSYNLNNIVPTFSLDAIPKIDTNAAEGNLVLIKGSKEGSPDFDSVATSLTKVCLNDFPISPNIDGHSNCHVKTIYPVGENIDLNLDASQSENSTLPSTEDPKFSPVFGNEYCVKNDAKEMMDEIEIKSEEIQKDPAVSTRISSLNNIIKDFESNQLTSKAPIPMKRQSYFSGLEIIDVENPLTFDSFITEDVDLSASGDSGLVNMYSSMMDSIDSTIQLPSSNQETENSSIQTPEFENWVKDKNIYSLDSNDSEDIQNYAMVISEKTLNSNNGNCLESVASNIPHIVINAATPEGNYATPIKQFIQTNNNLIENSPSESVTSCPTPVARFNDTIEEMELLLRSGSDYYKNENVDSKNTEEKRLTDDNGPPSKVSPRLSDESMDESIISPQKKMSVESTTSCFIPECDSTHTFGQPTHIEMSRQRRKCLTPTYSKPIKKKSFSRSCEDLSSLARVAPPKPARLLKSPVCDNKIQPLQLSGDRTPKISKTRKHIGVTGERKSDKKAPSPMSRSISTKDLMGIRSKLFSHPATPMQNKRGTPNTTPHVARVLKTPVPRVTPRNMNHVRTPSTNNSSMGRFNVSNSVKINKTKSSSQLSRPFLTPDGKKMSDKSPCASPRIPMSLKGRKNVGIGGRKGLNIVSPVAKYLQENPPPPFIATVRPRFKVSPIKMHGINFDGIHSSPEDPFSIEIRKRIEAASNDSPHLNESATMRQETVNNIQEQMDLLLLKVNQERAPLSCNSAQKKCATIQTGKKPLLPSCIYKPGPSAICLEKENVQMRGSIPSDNPASSVLKHRGRIMVASDGSPVSEFTPASEHLLEISVVEPRGVAHTQTLR